MSIEESSGVITTRIDDVFDYESQREVVVQIQAIDTLGPETGHHRVFAQLTINVLDENDETPEIRMPRNSPSIDENSPGGTLITDEIIGTDPDTTANMVFTILWDQSYATKAGAEADIDLYNEYDLYHH